MKEYFDSWRNWIGEHEIIKEAKMGKNYPFGDNYNIAFHTGGQVYVSKKGDREKKWTMETDPESFKYLQNTFLHGNDIQREVTRDDLLRGRFGKLVVIRRSLPDDEEEIDLDNISFDF